MADLPGHYLDMEVDSGGTQQEIEKGLHPARD